MKIKVGDQIEHGGQVFVVVDIRHEESMSNMTLAIYALDPETADQEQQKKMKTDQITHGAIDTLKNLLDKGSEGTLGFGFTQGG